GSCTKLSMADEATKGGLPALTFAVGALVEYDSASTGSWIPAKVLAHRPDGLYDLDCKPGVPSSRVRGPNFAPPEHQVGAEVEYFSETKGDWILARVQVYDAITGAYDLDVKPSVFPSRIRAAGTRPPTPGKEDTLPRLDAIKEERVPGTESFAEARAPPSAASRPLSSAREESGGSTGSTYRAEACAGSGTTPPLRLHKDGPLQLVKVSRRGSSWHFEVGEDAARVLEAAAGGRPLSVCTVCGPYRTGKSYLLNLLLGRNVHAAGHSQFRVGSTTRACTEGIWMWGAGDAPGADGTSLLFLDCEGFGNTDSDKTRDAKLMSLCMILSSVFLLNTKGVLNESLFNALSLVCHMSEHIEERGQEASKPALMWVLRDFLLELQDEVGGTLTPDEYLERSLHMRPPDGADPQRSRAAREVREILLRFFPQRHCATLAQPVIDEDALRDLSKVPFEQLRPEFRTAFQEMRSQLLRTARARPKTVAGQPVSANALVAMLRKLVQALNEGSALNVSSAWEQVQHTSCEALSVELRELAAAEMRKVRDGAALPIPGGRSLPVSDDMLAASMKDCRRRLRQEWRSRAVGDEGVRAEYWKDLKTFVADGEKSLQLLNAELASAQLQKVGSDWEAWLGEQEGSALPSDARSEALSLLIDDGLPWKPTALAAQEALGTARLARLRWDGSLAALKAELRLATQELASQATVADAATRLEGEQLQQGREVGRLRGQIEALQNQAREAIHREQILREQVLTADEATRKEKRDQTQERTQLEQTTKEVSDLRAELLQLQLRGAK
ncbi:unnamed protein product, partial [Polarella glacialis]